MEPIKKGKVCIQLESFPPAHRRKSFNKVLTTKGQSVLLILFAFAFVVFFVTVIGFSHLFYL